MKYRQTFDVKFQCGRNGESTKMWVETFRTKSVKDIKSKNSFQLLHWFNTIFGNNHLLFIMYLAVTKFLTA